MSLPLRHALTGAALAAALPCQRPQHSVAIVNDPRSHGQLGDNLLSLNEAIQLHNRTLLLSQLSQAEQGQIAFLGGDIALADIDTTVTTTVTLERDLDVIQNFPHGLDVRSSPYPATIVLGNTNGFLVDSDFCNFRHLVIRGGTDAVRVVQRDTYYGTTFENVRFEGQTHAAVQVYLGQDGGETFLVFENTTFANVPNPVRIDDLGRARHGAISMRGCLFDGGGEAFVLDLGPGGSSYAVRIERSTFQNQTTAGLVLRRSSAAADRGVVLDLVDLVTRNVPVGVSIDGHATALTDALVRMVDLGASATAMRLGSAGGNTKIAVEDSRFAGSMQLYARTTLRLDNVRVDGGATAIDAAPTTTLSVAKCGFANVALSVTGGSAAAVDGCRFDAGSVSGTPTSPVAIANSFVGTATLGANTTASASLPSPQLGSTDVVEQFVPVGQTVHLDHDLPPGYLGVWLFGLGDAQGPSLQAGMRVYIEMTTLAIYPGVFRGQGRSPFPVPPITALRGLDLVFQMLVGHDLGVPGPLRQMPPGGRIVLR